MENILEATDEFQDWEVLPSSNSCLNSSSSQSDDLRTCEINGSSLPEGIGEIVDEKMEKTEGLDNTSLRNEVEASAEEKLQNQSIGRVGMNGNENKNIGEIKKSGVVWWKMPMEFLRYCLFRMSPMWTVSVAAAVIGFVILGRRLYKMKVKAKILEIKVAFDDKKASQVMIRTARLNESFSVVKSIPVIRPSLPAAGVATWPARSLR